MSYFLAMKSAEIDRFQFAAIVDRLIYGAEETFERNDAVALYNLVPKELRRGGGLAEWFQFSAKGRVSGRGMSGAAAGGGTVQLPDEQKSFELDSAGRRVIRAGQWRLYPGRDAIEIEQVMATEIDEGKSARIMFRNGEPLRMELMERRLFSLGFVAFGYGAYRQWKALRG